LSTTFDISLPGDELHTKLGGGIPRSSVCLIEGTAGMGKSILIQRFCYGLNRNNVSISYISSEHSIQGFLNQMDSLRYEIRTDFLKGQFKFITLFPSIGQITFEPDMIKKIFASQKLLDSQVIVIDSLNDILIKNDTALSEAFTAVSMFKKLTSTGKSIIISIDPTTISKQVLQILQNISDVHIHMTEREQYGNKINLLQVKRFMGAANDVDKELPFKVRAGIGIVVELAS